MSDADEKAETPASNIEVEGDEDPSDRIDEGDEDAGSDDDDENGGKKTAADISVPDVDEEDEEVRMAMEMALAAMKNPKLSPDELRKLVESQQKQSEFHKEMEEKKAKQKAREQEEAQKRWNEQKERAFSWFTTSAAAIGQAAEDYNWQQTKAKYAEKIKKDVKIRETRKAIKAKRKSLKAVRLQGNRVETRHVFKRQRMEKHLIEVTDAVEKYRHQFCETNYEAHMYAKAVLKASKKWNKKPANDQELALEAQLCRNMHQMLALEKQKAKLKKTLRELKKYLQRCKSWLSDKQALCELHSLTLEATQSSMMNIYEDTLARQDKLIAKYKQAPEFAEQGDLQALMASVPDVQKYDEIPTHAGPGATLNALRGLPFRDSFLLAKVPSHEALGGGDKAANGDEPPLGGGDNDDDEASLGDGKQVVIEGKPSSMTQQQRKELYIATHDDAASINSALTDPDDNEAAAAAAATAALHDSVVSADSVSGNLAFGEDAPWLGDDPDDNNAAAAAGGKGNDDDDDDDDDGQEEKKRSSHEKSFDKKSSSSQDGDHAAAAGKKKSSSNGVHQKSPRNKLKAPPPSSDPTKAATQE